MAPSTMAPLTTLAPAVPIFGIQKTPSMIAPIASMNSSSRPSAQSGRSMKSPTRICSIIWACRVTPVVAWSKGVECWSFRPAALVPTKTIAPSRRSAGAEPSMIFQAGIERFAIGPVSRSHMAAWPSVGITNWPILT